MAEVLRNTKKKTRKKSVDIGLIHLITSCGKLGILYSNNISFIYKDKKMNGIVLRSLVD